MLNGVLPFALYRLGIVFYCIGSIDLLGAVEAQSESDREWWREWVWEQQQTGKFL